MKLACLRSLEGHRAAFVEGELLYPVSQEVGVIDLLASGTATWCLPKGAEPVALSAVELAPVIPHPRKVLCVGLNYHTHAAELSLNAPEYPNLWAKFEDSLIGAYDPIALPAESDQCDYEVELTVVIGRRVRRASRDDALEAIAGFAIGNDSSVRDWQLRTREAMQGKAWHRMTPVGPWLVPAAEVDYANDLKMRTYVNGELRQSGSTADMIRDPVWLVQYISTFVPLDPGDLILTGTPSGVGFTRNPPVYLKPGDVVRCEIDGLGATENVCVLEN